MKWVQVQEEEILSKAIINSAGNYYYNIKRNEELFNCFIVEIKGTLTNTIIKDCQLIYDDGTEHYYYNV